MIIQMRPSNAFKFVKAPTFCDGESGSLSPGTIRDGDFYIIISMFCVIKTMLSTTTS